MKDKEQRKSCPVESGSMTPQLPFKAALEQARRQINVEAIELPFRPFAEEIVKTVAEIYMLADSLPVRIDGEQLDAWTVKQIYAQLTEDHVSAVIHNFRRIPYEIRAKKSYIRTALYNAVFEFEAGIVNLFGATSER